jgi:hypothetical protein
MQENCDWLFGRCVCEGSSQIIPPELHSESSDSGIRHKIWYSGKFYVEGSNGEVCISGGGRDESL